MPMGLPLELRGAELVTQPVEALIQSRIRPLEAIDKIVPRGRFFFDRDEKFFLKGVTYGAFALSPAGVPFPEEAIVRSDFSLMAGSGVNCFRTFTLPPKWLLDKAVTYGLRAIIGIPWPQHISFLDSKQTQAEIREIISCGVADYKGHPGVFAYLIGNEIPPEMVRWHGARRIRAFLRSLHDSAKTIDSDALVSYANFPSTEYRETDFLDFIAFNVYLHREDDFRRYLSHLHNLAGDRPLVLTEIGIDSIRNGVVVQAETLAWQVRASFESGVAGTMIFSWTDDWHAYSGPEGFQVDDWAFGLVDRERRQKPSYWAVKRCYDEALPP